MWKIRVFKLFAAFAVLFLLHGCGKKEIEGEMFIVTNGRQNIALGSAAIYFVKHDEVIDHFAKSAREAELINKKKIVQLQKGTESLERNISESKNEIELIDNKIRITKEKLIQVALMEPEYASLFERYSKDNIDFYVAKISKNANTVTGPIVGELMSLSLDKFALLSASRDEAVQVNDLANEVKKGSASKKFADVIAEIKAVSKRSDSKVKVYTTITDSSGKFKSTLPAGVYWAFANEFRANSTGAIENMSWAIKIDFPKDSRIIFGAANEGVSDFFNFVNSRTVE